jgi:hypothetical protein
MKIVIAAMTVFAAVATGQSAAAQNATGQNQVFSPVPIAQTPPAPLPDASSIAAGLQPEDSAWFTRDQLVTMLMSAIKMGDTAAATAFARLLDYKDRAAAAARSTNTVDSEQPGGALATAAKPPEVVDCASFKEGGNVPVKCLPKTTKVPFEPNAKVFGLGVDPEAYDLATDMVLAYGYRCDSISSIFGGDDDASLLRLGCNHGQYVYSFEGHKGGGLVIHADIRERWWTTIPWHEWLLIYLLCGATLSISGMCLRLKKPILLEIAGAAIWPLAVIEACRIYRAEQANPRTQEAA